MFANGYSMLWYASQEATKNLGIMNHLDEGRDGVCVVSLINVLSHKLQHTMIDYDGDRPDIVVGGFFSPFSLSFFSSLV